MSSQRARGWLRVLWALTAAAVLLVVLRFFVADVYRVDSGSMRPTIFGGRDRPDGEDETEHVLVVYDRSPELERYDLVVLGGRDGSTPLVKRVCGLPGEEVAIVDGDLLIRDPARPGEPQRLPADAPRPEAVTVFDDRHLEIERFFEFPLDGSVRRERDEWLVTGGRRAPGTLLSYHPELRDDYLDRRALRVSGMREVNDAILELAFRIEARDGAARVRLRLVEEGDLFELELESGPAGSLWLVRRPAGAGGSARPPSVLAQVPVRLEPGRWYELAFANVDNHLTVDCAGLGLALVHTYEENHPWSGPARATQKNLGSRVAFGAEGGRARFRSVRIRRDFFYTDAGTHAVHSPLSLGPDEYFLLGDNSASSTDSRHFGPVRARDLIGRPVAVVWPGAHRLSGACRPPSRGQVVPDGDRKGVPPEPGQPRPVGSHGDAEHGQR